MESRAKWEGGLQDSMAQLMANKSLKASTRKAELLTRNTYPPSRSVLARHIDLGSGDGLDGNTTQRLALEWRRRLEGQPNFLCNIKGAPHHKDTPTARSQTHSHI